MLGQCARSYAQLKDDEDAILLGEVREPDTLQEPALFRNRLRWLEFYMAHQPKCRDGALLLWQGARMVGLGLSNTDLRTASAHVS